MNYSDALRYVHNIPKFVRPLGNEKLSGLLSLFGNPQNELKFVHVAGTNGKGSVCSMTAEILSRAGYKTGLFTSPFIEVFNERIRIDGKLIEDDALARYITDISRVMEDNAMQVSEFAFITAVALRYFADRECDIVVLETGMGGRLDATNIIPTPVCCALTSISLDHTQYLGDTIEEIAREKCGVIKRGGAVVSAQNVSVKDIIREAAKENNAALVICDEAVKTEGGFLYKGREYELGLLGEYQAENAAVVVELVDVLRERGYKISDDAVVSGLANAKWQARYEFVTPDIVIDGGHNIDGIKALKKSLVADGRPVTLVMAMMADKAYRDCIEEIIPICECVIATEVNVPRALAASEIEAICNDNGVLAYAIPDVKSAIEKAISVADGGLICVCGSLYLAGEAKQAIREIIS